MDYTPEEWMVVAAAREIQDGEVVFVGTGLPFLALALAKRTHAPNAVGYFEPGWVQDQLTPDLTSVHSASWTTQAIHLMGLLAQGAVDMGLVNVAQVDRYGNLNTTYIGPYHRPTRRLPGGGSAVDMASLARRFVVIVPHETQRLVEQVDYIAGPGFGTGQQWREGAGLPRGGPSAIVTTLGILRFDQNGESFLASYHPFTNVREVQANTGWPLKVAEAVEPTQSPSAAELEILRRPER